jgi:hypothetical protein
MSDELKLGDWVRVNETYQVGTIAGSTYGDELLIVAVPPFPGMPSYSVSVSSKDVTPIPAQTGSPRGPLYPEPTLPVRYRWAMPGVPKQ